MPTVEWKLKEYLAEKKIPALQVEERAGMGRNTIYRIMRGNGVKLIDRQNLGRIISALSELTGQPVALTDVLELVNDPTPEQLEQQEAEKRLDLETKGWMNAQLAPVLEPFDWGEAGPPTGQAVEVIGGQILVIGGRGDD